jgi:hypothetical protein
LGDQNPDIAASQRVWHGNIEQRLVERTAPDSESFDSVFTGPMTVLKAGWHAQFDMRPSHGTKNKALPGRLLEPGFGFLDGWIVFQSGLENTFKGDGAGSVHKTDQQEKEQEDPHPTTKCPLLEACAP